MTKDLGTTTQASIDAIFGQAVSPMRNNLEHLLHLATIGAKDPSALTLEEIKSVCVTLLIQYAQMGIQP